jgi:hypothetical protein
MPRKSKKGGAVQQSHITVAKERIWSCAVYARLSLEDSGRKGADTIETQIELVASYVLTTARAARILSVPLGSGLWTISAPDGWTVSALRT